jgi:chemotaxis protein MotA
MDLATILGLILGFTIVMVVMIMDGGSPAELFAHPSAILLTVGGAMTATMIQYPLKTTLSIPQMLMIAIKGSVPDPMPVIDILTDMADKARREGLLALEETARDLDDPFLKKGVMLVVDGVDPAQVRALLEAEIAHMKERHAEKYGFLSSAGGFGPTLGIIGTVMGLITILKELDEPSKLGTHIAAAFLATLWGIMSANLFWLPLGGKLLNKSEIEAAYRHMIIEGIESLQAGENPRMVREKLLTFLPPKEREAQSEREAERPAVAQQAPAGGD